MTPLLIRHPRILLPNGEFLLGDILMEGGKIVQVSPEITAPDDITITDATGLTLLPGMIDPQVHFRESSLVSSGLRGGITNKMRLESF